MSPQKSSTDGQTDKLLEELAYYKGEVANLTKTCQKLRDQSANAHRKAAEWAAAAGELMRILGKETLDKHGYTEQDDE